MNQNTELVKSLEELADAGPLIHCQSWSYIQRICMKSAVTLSTQERVIGELREVLSKLLRQVSCEPEGVLKHMNELAGRLRWYEELGPIKEQARAALSKRSGQ